MNLTESQRLELESLQLDTDRIGRGWLEARHYSWTSVKVLVRLGLVDVSEKPGQTKAHRFYRITDDGRAALTQLARVGRSEG